MTRHVLSAHPYHEVDVSFRTDRKTPVGYDGHTVEGRVFVRHRYDRDDKRFSAPEVVCRFSYVSSGRGAITWNLEGETIRGAFESQDRARAAIVRTITERKPQR